VEPFGPKYLHFHLLGLKGKGFPLESHGRVNLLGAPEWAQGGNPLYRVKITYWTGL